MTTGLKKWGGLIVMLVGVGGLFLVNSVLMYDKLIQVDDEINNSYAASSNSGKDKRNHWNSLSSLTARQRHLAVVGHSKGGDSASHSAETTARSNRATSGSAQDKSIKTQQDKIQGGSVRGKSNSLGNLPSPVTPLSTLHSFQQSHPSTDTRRIRDFVHSLRDHDFDQRQRKDLPYDIFNCPDEPPLGYPMVWKALEVLDHWGVDDTDLPTTPIHQGLCVFDWDTEQTKAETYRAKELPFVLKNHPGVMETAERWMTPDYLPQLFGDEPQRNEHGANNHLMFWRTLSPAQQKQYPEMVPEHWEAPTDMVQLSYNEWLKKAQALQDDAKDQTQEEHFYFRLNAYRPTNTYLYNEMPFFDPKRHPAFVAKKDPNAFLMVDASDHRGINCRFGQRGTIAEMHFDSTRNFVVLLGGQRRYILAHPDQCNNVDLYDRNHPSGRHSKVNWSNPTDTSSNGMDPDQDPPLSKAMINEVVMQAGDVLYLPTYWFHMIISLNVNYQCNSRSGVTNENHHFLKDCGMEMK